MLPKSFGIAKGWPIGSGQTVATLPVAPTLGTLSLSSTNFTITGTSSANIIGATAGSTITATSSDGTVLTVSAGTLSGSFTVAGSPGITLTETLAGATGSPKSSVVPVTVAAASGPALPSGAVYRLSSDDITPQANNTALATDWTDRINGAPAARASGFEPKYMTGGMNGRPFLRFDGVAKGLNAGRPAALTAAIDSQTYTVLLVVKNVLTTQYGPAFAAGTGGSLLVGANGASAGYAFGGNYNKHALPWVGANLTNRLMIGITADSNGRPGGGRLSRAYLNSTCLGASDSNDFPTSGGGNFGIGGTFDGGFLTKLDIYDVVVWPRALTQIEVMQAQMFFDTANAQPYPWTAAPKFTIMTGSSLVSDANASDKQFGLSYRTAQLLSQPIGTWTNLAIGGQSVNSLPSDLATNLFPIPALIGVPCRAMWQEWFNSRGDASILSKSQTIISNFKNAGIKIAWSTGAAFSLARYTEGSPVTRAQYNQASNWTTADAYVDFSADANIGVDGASPASGGNTYYIGDGLHWTGVSGTCGNSVAATYFANGLSGL